MSAHGGKADIIQGKADIKKCPLAAQTGQTAAVTPNCFQSARLARYDALSSTTV
jgi:hypothetical protein